NLGFVVRMVCQANLQSAHYYFVFTFLGDNRDLHSFPTRRSSDLPSPLPSPGQAFCYASSSSSWYSSSARRCSSAGESRGSGLSRDRKSTRLNSSHVKTSYAVFCLKKKNTNSVKLPT